MADVKFKVVRKLIRTTIGVETFTVSGFGTPKAAMFFTTNAQTNDTNQANAVLGIGFTDGTTNRSFSIGAEDGVTTTNTDRRSSDTRCILALNGSSITQLVEGDFNAFVTDGIDIDITTAPATATYVTCILIGGADVTDIHIDDKSMGTSASTIDITDPGFEPDLVFIGGMAFSVVTQGSTNSIIHFGAAHNGGNQKAIAYADQNAQSTSTVSMSARSEDLNGQVIGSAQTWFASVSDFDSNGFSMTPSSNAASDFIFYMALKFSNNPDIAVFSMDAPSSGGEQAITDPGFLPTFGMILASDCTSEDTLQDSAVDAFGIGVFDGSTEVFNSVSSEDNVGTSNVKTRSTDKAVSQLQAGSGSAHVGTFTSFDTNGWTIDYSTAVGVRKWIGIAIGDGPGSKFDLQRQNIIDGLTSAQTETLGWNNEVRDKEAVTSVVRTSDNVVTVTLSASASYDITAQETITDTITATALIGGIEIVATPTFTVDIVTSGTVLTPDEGDITVVGQDVVLAAETLLDPDNGDITLVGQDVIITESTVLNVDDGAVSVTGFNVTIETSLSPNIGSISLTGEDVDLTLETALFPDKGDIVIQGKQVTITAVGLGAEEVRRMIVKSIRPPTRRLTRRIRG